MQVGAFPNTDLSTQAKVELPEERARRKRLEKEAKEEQKKVRP